MKRSRIEQMTRPVLSFILCSRNDRYMGNSPWRLQTTLNYLTGKIRDLGREEETEIIVTDWGSEIPLREALTLGPGSAGLVSFVEIPPETARTLQKDSPFAEVLALNAAARRASGEFIGRIDQDTLVGKRFLELFFDLYKGKRKLEVPLTSALMFANRRSIPYRLSVRCPDPGHLETFLRLFGRKLKIWKQNQYARDKFWTSYVGIWLLHRDLWELSGGYDERLIYYNWMETDMILRLARYHPVIDLGRMTGYDFYHLEHYNPAANLRVRPHSMKNPDIDIGVVPEIMRPSGPAWGLAEYPFDRRPYSPGEKKEMEKKTASPAIGWLSFARLTAVAAGQTAWDQARIVVFGAGRIWRHRAQIAREAVRGRRLSHWPRLLAGTWREKARARKTRLGRK
jgi:hypothetical protein